jgi:hypothetical protein
MLVNISNKSTDKDHKTSCLSLIPPLLSKCSPFGNLSGCVSSHHSERLQSTSIATHCTLSVDSNNTSNL